jgi:hypothetical protein
MIFEVIDDVELDIASAEQVQRTARVASSGVVIKGYAFHWFPHFLLVSPEPSPGLSRRITGEGPECIGL